MHFHILKQFGSKVGSGENSPQVHYIPGIPVGGWAILYSGNGAGDSHTFTSILTSTDETSSHEEQTEAYSKSVTNTRGVDSSLTLGLGVDIKVAKGDKSVSFGASWEASESTTDSVAETVANT